MIKSWFAAIILSLGVWGHCLYAYSGGSGTASDPYEIASAEDLIALGDTPEDYDKHFLLTRDIDLSGQSSEGALIAPDTGAVDETFEGTPFTGAFVGDGHVIRNLHIDGGEFVGLFGYLGRGAVIHDLGVENVTVNGSADWIGGLVGYNDHGSVSCCYSSGAVTGTDYVGGLVGNNYAGTVSTCYSTATVTGRGIYAGGLAGGNVYASLSDSYSTGAVTGDNSVGGLLGYNYGCLSNCYSVGAVSGTGNSIGGLVASSLFSRGVVACYWDVETSGQTSSARGTGRTTAQMQTNITFQNAGWDFVGETDKGAAEVWQMGAAGGYPRLAVFEGREPVKPAGQGTAAQPFLITTAAELASVRYRPEAHYRLDADLSLAGISFNQAVIPSFSGHFDGNRHTIRDLDIRGAGYLGLFAFLGARARIENLALEDGSVKGSEDYIGSIAGLSCGSVANCYSVAGVEGFNMIGGLLGSAHGGTTRNCYCMGSVSGNFYTGGLIGEPADSIVRRCYSTARVSAEAPGGLVGIDLASRVTSSIWDVEASGVTGSEGGAGLSTAEMMDPQMLALNGFANDPNWTLNPGQDYPRLAWEGTEGQVIPTATPDWLAGSGTADAPYEIETADQLLKVGKSSLLWDRDFALLADLDLDPNLPNGSVRQQAIISCFTGHFDGQGHRIKNLHIIGGGHLGFFGILRDGAKVTNLALEGLSIDGPFDKIGGLAGEVQDAEIVQCSTSGIIVGRQYVGGLVGEARQARIAKSQSDTAISGFYDVGGLVGTVTETSVTECCSSGRLSGSRYVGGLIGNHLRSETRDCYSTADVIDAYRYGGGLIGYSSESTTSNCYSAGHVTRPGNDVGGMVGAHWMGHAEQSFWDTETSGMTYSATGKGLPTREMCKMETYLDAGWDFTDEMTNGREDVWRMPPYEGYPMLVSQGEMTPEFVTEGFETGDLSHLGWSPGYGASVWRVTSDEAHTGNFSIRAGQIGDNERTTLTLMLDCVDGNIRFFVKISSEDYCDKVHFSINGTEVAHWMGEMDWTEVSFPVSKGQRIFQWEYVKDNSASGGADTAWIDDITFPSQVWSFGSGAN